MDKIKKYERKIEKLKIKLYEEQTDERLKIGNKILKMLGLDYKLNDCYFIYVENEACLKSENSSMLFSLYFQTDKVMKLHYWRNDYTDEISGDDDLMDAFENYMDNNDVWQLLNLIPPRNDKLL